MLPTLQEAPKNYQPRQAKSLAQELGLCPACSEPFFTKSGLGYELTRCFACNYPFDGLNAQGTEPDGNVFEPTRQVNVENNYHPDVIFDHVQ